MKKKHIVVISGLTLYTKLLRMPMIEEFLKKGYIVTVMGNEKSKEWKEYFKKFNVSYRTFYIDRNGLNPVRDIKTILSIRKVLKEINPDIVFLYQAKTVIYGTIASNSITSEIYSMVSGLGSIFRGQGIKNRVLSKILGMQYKIALKRNKKIFFHNHDDKDFFVKKNIVDNKKAIVIPGSGVDMKKFPKAELPKNNSFLFVGRLLKDKGIKEFLLAAEKIKRKHKEVNFNIIGRFDSNPSAIKKSELDYYIENNIVNYFGEVNNVLKHLKLNQVLVLPSYHEGLPNSVVEAMSVGRPIITTDAPGCKETVTNGKNGYLVKPKSFESLEKSMNNIIDKSYYKLKEMGDCSNEICRKKFDVKIVNEVIIREMEL